MITKVNYDYYNGKDSYCDGESEDIIISLLKKKNVDNNKIIEKNKTWPFYYHFSPDRVNIIAWYPFTKKDKVLEVGAGMGALTSKLCDMCGQVTSIELSKKRAKAIEKRNMDCDNLEIIVGNYKDIHIDTKYDYILLNGVFEYSALYYDTDNPFEDFLISLKSKLKNNGKILIAIENKLGLKYWCGAKEDHTGIQFDGLLNYASNSRIKTFSMSELIDIAKKVNMRTSFKYVYPDYKFPEIIFDDNIYNSNIEIDYNPYYYCKSNLVLNEQIAFKNIHQNKMSGVMANSFFVELSESDFKSDISFVNFNNYRNSQFSIMTMYNGKYYYKKPFCQDAISHINKIMDIYQKINTYGIQMVEHKYEDGAIIIKPAKGDNLFKRMSELFYDSDKERMIMEFNSIYNFIKAKFKVINDVKGNDTFDEYGVKVSSSLKQKMSFTEYAVIDLVPKNIFVNRGKFTLIDQEWDMYNVPIEFVLYRSIKYFFASLKVPNLNELIEEYCSYFFSNDLIDVFEKLDNAFVKRICINMDIKREYMGNGKIYNLDSLVDYAYEDINNMNNKLRDYEIQKQELELKLQELEIEKNKNDILINELSSIKNSKKFKLFVMYDRFVTKTKNIFKR